MDRATFDEMRTALRGPVTGPGDEDYDRARAVYNAMIDKRPGAIVRCRDAQDVAAAVGFAREHDVEIAVRGGGHSGPGLGLVDGGMTIDLSPMDSVHADPDAAVVRAGGGVQLGDLDRATHAVGAATPAGIVSTTGIGGLALGGGHGYLTRRYGLTVDSLLGADVVLADGTQVTAGPADHPDLYWALRGGGGNFGVVTSFTFRMHPVHTVGVALTLWPVERTAEVLDWYRGFMPRAPQEMYGFFAVLAVPPAPPFPQEIHGKKMCGVVWCHTGDDADGGARDLLDAAEGAGRPVFAFAAPMPYPALQGMFDELLPPGLQWYWRGDFFDTLPDAALEVEQKYAEAIPTGLSTMHLYPVDAAAHCVPRGETAWSYRDAVWSGVYAGIDPDPLNAGVIKRWCVDFWNEMHPYSMGGAYVNFVGADEGTDRVRATYRDHYDRLARVKRTYDPDNVFHVNQNIEPS
ncbi:FAD-binding oxidoreductase [Streptomyces sp. NPDC049555]|uniref:FAD-binding oxidoreductase n=1 Tax=Streptomyces sp. NPDC049555 TaxID=3154930 RepID=UPI0034487EDD